MLKFLRPIAHPDSVDRSARRRSHAWMRRSGKLLALTVVAVFFADAINVDVLYAAFKGDIRFQDNPLILDSQFDTTSVVPDLGHAINYFALVKSNHYSSTLKSRNVQKFIGVTLMEDVDSPTVLDGTTTATLIYHTRTFARMAVKSHRGPPTTIDRTISYLCLLI